MERLYQKIGRFYSAGEIVILAGDLGIFVPQNVDRTSMARELFLGAQRNLRLDVLFKEVYSRNPGARPDLRPNLYELIAGTFNEEEAVKIAHRLGLDEVNSELNKAGFIGWNHDDYFKSNKAKLLQETAEKEGKFDDLLVEMKRIRSRLDLTIFETAGGSGQPSDQDESSSQTDRKSGENTPQPSPSVIHQYLGDVIYGDKVGGDKTGGDKVGGDMIKDVTVSDVKDSAIAFKGDSSVNRGGDSSDLEALLLLVEKMNEALEALRSDLDPSDAADVADTLQEVRNEIEKEEPSSRVIGRKLTYIATIIRDAGVVVAASNQLGSYIDEAIEVAGKIFGG